VNGRALLVLLLGALLVAVVPGDRAAAVLSGPTLVTAAGAGVFPGGTSLSGVNLSGGTFGYGVAVFGDGSARGDFQTILAGTNALGGTTQILVVGWVTGGALNADGSVTINGTASVDMRNGTLPSTGVPFSATITTGGFQLTVGTSTLATLLKSAGWIYIEQPQL
jgi:hypothetical protein